MVSKSILCCVSVVLCSLLTAIEGLKANDFGVCEGKTSVTKTKKVYYRATINKWCGRKRCTVLKSKTLRYSQPVKQQVCCKGFVYESATDSCQPHCSTGCNGGQCVAPDVCQCNPPAISDGNGTCVTCEPACFNAKCIGNNTCLCDDGFTSYNASHCYHCEPGFTIDELFNCVPKCENTCVNADCTSPDTCTCRPGYRKRDESTCDPHCDCVNANCVAPNVCECIEGYVKINDTHCLPTCDNCYNGTCVGHNDCECDVGYNKTDRGCAPVCDASCSNGFCSEPNVCLCDDGYHNVNNDSSQSCIKNCPGGLYDVNGECASQNCTTMKYAEEPGIERCSFIIFAVTRTGAYWRITGSFDITARPETSLDLPVLLILIASKPVSLFTVC